MYVTVYSDVVEFMKIKSFFSDPIILDDKYVDSGTT